jgi:hypothetical protein
MGIWESAHIEKSLSDSGDPAFVLEALTVVPRDAEVADIGRLVPDSGINAGCKDSRFHARLGRHFSHIRTNCIPDRSASST